MAEKQRRATRVPKTKAAALTFREQQIKQAVDAGWEIVRCDRCQRQLRGIGAAYGETEPIPLYMDPASADLSPNFCQECDVLAREAKISVTYTLCADADPAHWQDYVLHAGQWITRQKLLEDYVELGVSFRLVCTNMQAAQFNADMARYHLELGARLRELADALTETARMAAPSLSLPYTPADTAEDLSDAIGLITGFYPPEPSIDTTTERSHPDGEALGQGTSERSPARKTRARRERSPAEFRISAGNPTAAPPWAVIARSCCRPPFRWIIVGVLVIAAVGVARRRRRGPYDGLRAPKNWRPSTRRDWWS